jgi:hypothetical protein
MPRCSLRTQIDHGPWKPCLQPGLPDPDREVLCVAHMAQLWTCPACGWFIAAGDATLCPTCQAEADALDG